MQKDSRHPSQSGNMTHNQVAPQQSPIQSFQCSHCVLIFKTKLFLLEHLSKVHGFNVDSALRNAGLTSPGTNSAYDKPDIRSEDSGDVFSCQHCVFKASRWEVVIEHEKTCHKTSPQKVVAGSLQKKSMKDKGVSSKSPENKVVVTSNETEMTNHVKTISPLQDKQAARAKGNSSLKSTSKTKSITNSSKDLKTYMKPSQTITKHSSVTNVKPPPMSMKSPDFPGVPNRAEGTLILHNSHSNSNPTNDGVFKVAATSKNNLSSSGHDHFLLFDRALIKDPPSLQSDISDGQFKGPFTNKVGKRTLNNRSRGAPTKKMKQDLEKEASTAITTKLSSSDTLSFEVSEDEEERKVLGMELDGKAHRPNGDTDSSQTYSCKHCDYSDEGIPSICTHYQKIHPYIRYKSEYIQDPNDQSATFRCLECPVEFSTVDDLKRHFTENHPEAPDVLTMRSHGLVFKCFVCPFTTHISKDLKEHYQEKHPTHDVSNSLMYCRYSASKCQEGSSQYNTCEKICSPKSSDRTSLKHTPSKESLPSQQSPTSKVVDVELYQCKNCKFSHKSLVVMHVHYQKSHPEAGVTIDKIKQSAHVSHTKLQVTPEKISESPNLDTIMDKSLVSRQKNISDSSKKTRDKSELSKQRKVSSSLMNPKGSLETSPQNLAKSSKDKDVETAEVSSKGKRSAVKSSPTQSNEKLTAGMDSSCFRSPENVFYCQFCQYYSPNVKSVISHHNAKHVGQTSVSEIFRYSTEVHKQKPQSKVEASASSPSSDSKTYKQVEVYCEKDQLKHEDKVTADTSAHVSNAYERAEDLFFCQKCNFAHTSVKGVLNHQCIRHRNLKSTTDQVLRYTGVIRGEIKKSKSHAMSTSFLSSGLPLPLLDEGDEGKLFCHLCNSRQKSLCKVLAHHRKRHPGLEIKAKQVFEYSSMVHEQSPKLQPKTTAEQAVKHTSLGQSGNEKLQTKKPGNSISVSPSSRSVEQIRSLRCNKCTYKTQQLYLLKRHLRHIHKTSHTITDVLKMAFRDGILQPGYHCEWCVFSHKEATGVHQHCKERHATRGVSLEHITARLYVGPKVSTYIKKKPHLEDTDDTGDCDERSQFQRSGKNETKTYPCKACSFKGSSLQSITSHYRAVHPWSVKEDGSVLDVVTSKVLSASRQVQDVQVYNELTESFDSFQVPVEFETLIGVSSHEATAFSKNKCRFCLALFNTRHGLLTHYGRKHPKCLIESSDDEQEVKNPTSEHGTRLCVFKCPRCTYVNTTFHGILTHCQMKHPTFTARADKLQTDEVQLPNVDECVRTKGGSDKLRFSGYMCKICPVIRGSLKKLKLHYEQDHNQTVPNMLKPVSQHPPVIKKQLLSKYHSTQGTILQAAFFKNKKSAAMKCRLCKYVSNTKIGLSHHLRIHHKNEASEAGNQDCVFKCSLCSYSSYIRKYLARHYKRQHGKAAYLKYYASVIKQICKKPNPTSVDHPGTQHPEDTPETCQSSTPTIENEFIYKCRLCTYSALIRRYLASHYKKTHGRAAFNTYFVPQYKQLQSTKCEDENVSRLPEAESEESPPLKCKKCFNSLFNSSQLLSAHYTSFHSTDFKLDFTVLSSTSKKGSEVYKCGHCSIKIHSDPRDLCCHLDHHRELYKSKANAVKTKTPLVSKKTPEAKTIKLKRQEELPEFQTVQELARWNVTKVETFTLAASPSSSPSKTPEREEPQLESRVYDYTCKLCRRTFMSLTGLRVHERSHAALKRLDTLPTASSKRIFNKYISYRSGTTKPFHCGICSYRTTVMGLLRSHLMKTHGAEYSGISMTSVETVNQDEESTLRADEEPPHSPDIQEGNCLTEPYDESEIIQKSLYSEPPDVQRQLNHYSMMAQASASALAALQETKPPDDSLLHCEFCNFSSGHLSSIRRHYSNRHGKRLFRCKDCCFFTGLRKTLEMHIETGHSNCPSEPTHQKNLRCPLCLYQTKNKNNMIDHIVLHREERVMPIEVCRPKLSRYLQGIVFRCHKCTFTSANAENLHSHMLKHEDIKPYKCRLCYFDCTQLSDLEAHLCDKHQVMRNHELVGQINLDQLEARVGKMSEEEEGWSNLDKQRDEDEDMETSIQHKTQGQEGENIVEPNSVSHEHQEKNASNHNNEEHVVNDNEVPHQKQAESLAGSDIRETVAVQNEEPHQKHDTWKENTESQVSKTTALVFQYENIAKQNHAVHQKQEQDGQEEGAQDQAGDEMFLVDAANGQEVENTIEQSEGEEGNRAKNNLMEGKAKQNGEQEMDENRAQCKPKDGKEDVIEQNYVLQEGQKAGEESSTKNDTMAEMAQASKLHTKSVQDTKDAMKQNIETKLEEDIHQILLDREGSITSPHNLEDGYKLQTEIMPDIEKQKHTLAKNLRAKDSSTAEWPTATQNHEHIKTCHKKQDDEESLAEEQQVHRRKHEEGLMDPYGEMPVLENEYLKEEVHSHGCQKPLHTEEEVSDCHDQKQERGGNVNQYMNREPEEEERMLQEAGNPFAPHGSFTATDGAAQRPLTKDERLFACKLCGRNLINRIELERHIMRHGM